MKKCYNRIINFTVNTDVESYSMTFSVDWTFQEMLDWMIDHYSIDLDLVVEISNCQIRQYKVVKDV